MRTKQEIRDEINVASIRAIEVGIILADIKKRAEYYELKLTQLGEELKQCKN